MTTNRWRPEDRRSFLARAGLPIPLELQVPSQEGLARVPPSRYEKDDDDPEIRIEKREENQTIRWEDDWFNQ